MQDLDESLPIFKVERVQLQFSISSDFVAAQVANNVLVLALSTGRILRIDLDSPSDIDGSYTPHIENFELTMANQILIYQRRHQRSA